MKQLIACVCLVLATTSYAFAQQNGKDGDRKASAVAEKTTASEARKNDEKKFDSGTESAKTEPTEKQKATQGRMKDCAAKAGDRKGDERKRFMSECLSNA
jgi:hypothetical protein